MNRRAALRHQVYPCSSKFQPAAGPPWRRCPSARQETGVMKKRRRWCEYAGGAGAEGSASPGYFAPRSTASPSSLRSAATGSGRRKVVVVAPSPTGPNLRYPILDSALSVSYYSISISSIISRLSVQGRLLALDNHGVVLAAGAELRYFLVLVLLISFRICPNPRLVILCVCFVCSLGCS